MVRKRGAKLWQLRLSSSEDADVDRTAAERMLSKNDVVRRALHLLFRLEREVGAGGRLLIERPGSDGKDVEVWLLW
jgi:ferric-dicitrate binding protein FerR (iron transport regulator)